MAIVVIRTVNHSLQKVLRLMRVRICILSDWDEDLDSPAHPSGGSPVRGQDETEDES